MIVSDQETGRGLIFVGVFFMFAGIVEWGLTNVFVGPQELVSSMSQLWHALGTVSGIFGIALGGGMSMFGLVSSVLPEPEIVLPEVIPAWSAAPAAAPYRSTT
jgi:hypothetical protein